MLSRTEPSQMAPEPILIRFGPPWGVQNKPKLKGTSFQDESKIDLPTSLLQSPIFITWALFWNTFSTSLDPLSHHHVEARWRKLQSIRILFPLKLYRKSFKLRPKIASESVFFGVQGAHSFRIVSKLKFEANFVSHGHPNGTRNAGQSWHANGL